MKTEIDFYDDIVEFNQSKNIGAWNLPVFNLFHSTAILCFSLNMFITPIGYFFIFKYKSGFQSLIVGSISCQKKKGQRPFTDGVHIYSVRSLLFY